MPPRGCHPGAGNEILILSNSDRLSAWTEQTEYLALQLGCASQLHGHCALPQAGVPQTLDAVGQFLHDRHIDAAIRLITSTIHAGVFAYARALGYNTVIDKSPVELYNYVRLAASSIDLVYRGQQTAEDASRIVTEWQLANRHIYPREVNFDLAVEWLEAMIRRRYGCGDRRMGETIAVIDMMQAQRRIKERLQSHNEPLPLWPPAMGSKRNADEAFAETGLPIPVDGNFDPWGRPAKRQAHKDEAEVKTETEPKIKMETDY